MNTKLIYKILLCTFIIILTFFNLSVWATDTNSNDIMPISSNFENDVDKILATYETNYEYTSSDLILYDVNVKMSEIVDGNVFAYGSSVDITGEIYEGKDV